MTFSTDNTTFAQNLCVALVARGFTFKFFKTYDSPHGDFNFHITTDQIANMIREMAATWGIGVYEIQDDEQD